jgi:hypothetical protein
MRIRIEQYDTQIEINLDEDCELENIIDAMLGCLRSLGWHESTIDKYITEMAETSEYGKRKNN